MTNPNPVHHVRSVAPPERAIWCSFLVTLPRTIRLEALTVVKLLPMIRDILEEMNSGLEQVVQVTMLITDPSDYAACNTEYIKHFPGGLPARHTVRFGVPTEARVAFSCIAVTKT